MALKNFKEIEITDGYTSSGQAQDKLEKLVEELTCPVCLTDFKVEAM